mmetsp:Transcript_51828/g.121683  ORF Transcript_51828/g.121683 Transcript_51828/m.121683 type:complete len:222 (-) Transcript_51828:1074-1739(-)
MASRSSGSSTPWRSSRARCASSARRLRAQARRRTTASRKSSAASAPGSCTPASPPTRGPRGPREQGRSWCRSGTRCSCRRGWTAPSAASSTPPPSSPRGPRTGPCRRFWTRGSAGMGSWWALCGTGSCTWCRRTARRRQFSSRAAPRAPSSPTASPTTSPRRRWTGTRGTGSPPTAPCAPSNRWTSGWCRRTASCTSAATESARAPRRSTDTPSQGKRTRR